MRPVRTDRGVLLDESHLLRYGVEGAGGCENLFRSDSVCLGRGQARIMINGEIAAAFSRIADLLEINGGEAFRVNSYRRIARFLKSHPHDIAVAAAEKTLKKLPGIGKGAAQKITEYIETGRISLLDELESELPAELPELLRIQGLGPKKIAQVYRELEVTGIEDLKRVIESGSLADLPGFGEQSVKKITDGIEFLEQSGGRTPMGVARRIAEVWAALVREMPRVNRVDIAGSLRRGAETVGDIDLLCECEDGARVVKAFADLPGVRRVLAAGETKGSVTVEASRGRELQIDLRVVPVASYGAALQYFTGSKEHNVRLRETAAKKNRRLNEYGLFAGDERVAGETEESIYEALGVPFIPPELREDRGEFDLDGAPSLITIDQVRGDLHMHTIASDGRCTIEEMAAAARQRGYEYIAITDHSKSSTIANGLSEERLLSHIEAIAEVDARLDGITILAGCECDILTDGSLDYDDEILARCDVVVASIHARSSARKVTPTERLLEAIANPYTTMIGHTTGRLINERPALEIDMDRVLSAAAESGTVMEVNASWQRLDLNAIHVRQAIDLGVMLAINTDAHHIDGLDQMGYGIATARRGWATPDVILNTMPIDALRAWTRRKRDAAG